MAGYMLLHLASLITFTFAALVFSSLSLVYWRERRAHHAGSPVFFRFTLACAAAFLLNLMLLVRLPPDTGTRWSMAISAALQLAAGMLPALMLHAVYEDEALFLPGPGRQGWVLTCFYSISAFSALSNALDELGLVIMREVWMERASVLVLGGAGILGLAAQLLSRRSLSPAGRRHRHWVQTLLVLMVVCAAAAWAWPDSPIRLLPDYVVLAFFGVALYYRERLVFFDFLFKRGAFFALGLIGLTTFCVLGGRLLGSFSDDWSRPWIFALALTPFWLMGPWIYRRLERLIDRTWLRRRYTPEEAERRFTRDAQAAVTEEEMSDRAAQSLSDIFDAHAEVLLNAGDGVWEPGGLGAPILLDGTPNGQLRLGPRPSLIPYMSDDRRLLQSLAGTLGVLLENVRYRTQRREQEDREERLLWLASRAELKALRAQINPHFLFNALNAIAGLIHVQPQLADETIERLAMVFRYILRASEAEWVRLGEEMDFVASYLQVEHARFGPRLSFRFDIHPDAAAVRIPAMTVQPLIENAIKHGASMAEGGGRVGLRAWLLHQELRVEVSDNGPGFPPGFALDDIGEGHIPGGHGLRNVLERLRGYYGGGAGLSWENGSDGTKVTLAIPAERASAPHGDDVSYARSDRG